MKILSKNILRNILRILVTIVAIFYLFVVIDEGTPPFTEPLFGIIMVYALFLFFVLGYYYLWKNEKLSGILLIVWYGLLWILVFCVWENAALTIIMGIPIPILGILLLIYSYLKKLRKTKQS